uniref:Solute carrier family 25 member 33 n=1 Tax=Eptatretus burgeri TaxID=7764 RepID=A0A8C4R392_EPTBU
MRWILLLLLAVCDQLSWGKKRTLVQGLRGVLYARFAGSMARLLQLCGGAVGAIVTCPLDVVKTRLQSSGSLAGIRPMESRRSTCLISNIASVDGNTVRFVRGHAPQTAPSLLRCLQTIVEKEGMRSLFRGLGPNLVGMAPSRAIYFAAYSRAKDKFSTIFQPSSSLVHISSAACAGFITNTCVNPIWLVKTRLQLYARHRDECSLTALQCTRHVYRTEGIRGFYRGITASYVGILETIIYFTLYEAMKDSLLRNSTTQNSIDGPKKAIDFLHIMFAAAISKSCACCLAYPHEVGRTRLREEGTKYRSFVQTLLLVVREEGYRALYRGLQAHLLRQIPNTALTMATYELVVHLFSS